MKHANELFRNKDEENKRNNKKKRIKKVHLIWQYEWTNAFKQIKLYDTIIRV